MKGKGKEDILALVTLKLSSEHRFGQTEGVTNVQVSIGVGIGKGHQEGLFRRVGIRLKGFQVGPLFLHDNLILTQGIALGRALGGVDLEILHGGFHGFLFLRRSIFHAECEAFDHG